MPSTNIHVVVVDDDREDFLLIKDLLSSANGRRYTVDWVDSSRAALAEIRKQAADVYLIDYRLDDMTGLDILGELQALDLKKPMILLTGRGDLEIDLAAMQKGASDFLSKDGLTAEGLGRSIRYSIKRAEDHERLREIEKLKIENEVSDAANRAKSQFIASMSHEIRTPLAAILGFADLALDPSMTDIEKTTYLSIIKKNGECLLEIINNVLDLSRVEAGFFEIVKEDFNWSTVVKDVIETMRPQATAKGLNLEYQFGRLIPEILTNDSQRFRQILFNLIGNAIKFTDKGSIRVLCEADEHSDSLSILVEDTGIGLSIEDQKKIFRPFVRSDAVSQRLGSGLGLDLSKKLASAMGGDLTLISSTPNVGSAFLLNLPIGTGVNTVVYNMERRRTNDDAGSENSKNRIQLVQEQF